MSNPRAVSKEVFEKTCRRLIEVASRLKSQPESVSDRFFRDFRESRLNEDCSNREALSIQYADESPLKFLARTGQHEAVDFVLGQKDNLVSYIKIEDALSGFIEGYFFEKAAMIFNEIDETIRYISENREEFGMDAAWTRFTMICLKDDLVDAMKKTVFQMLDAGASNGVMLKGLCQFYATLLESPTRNDILYEMDSPGMLREFVFLMNVVSDVRKSFATHHVSEDKIRILNHFVDYFINHIQGRNFQKIVKEWLPVYKAENNGENPFVTLHNHRRTGLTSIFNIGEPDSVSVFRKILKSYPKDDELELAMAKPIEQPKPEESSNQSFVKRWFGVGS